MTEEVLRVVIADDEPLARLSLRRALEELGGVEILAEAENGQEALDAIRRDEPDLVFLDVEMPEMRGFEVIDELDVEHPPVIIFVTAHAEHALHAFEVRAMDYLVKPFTDARLADALARARDHLTLDASRRFVSAVRGLVRSFGSDADALGLGEAEPEDGGAENGGDAVVRRFTVPTDTGRVFVKAGDVEWIEASRNYALLHVGDRTYRLRMTLAALEKKLDPRKFVRVHRSSILNVDYVSEVQSWFSGDYIALLKGGGQVRVSRTYKDALLRTSF